MLEIKEVVNGEAHPLHKLFNSQCEGLLTDPKVDIVESDLAISQSQ